MQSFANGSLVVMLLASSIVGGRLLLRARQTRQLPELAFGIGLLGAGVGLGCGQLGTNFVWTAGTPFATAVSTALFGLVVAGVVALHVAIWRVFHPNDIWGFASFAIGSGLALVAWGMRIGSGDFSTGTFAGAGMQVFCFASIWVLVWASCEALSLFLQLRRRARLGLSDGLAASQIGMWGIAASLCALMTVVISYNVFQLDRSPMNHVPSTLVLLLTVVGASGAMWCAFFPPTVLRSASALPE